MTLSCDQQLRRDLLLKALEVYRDTETAMAATLQMERFVRSGEPAPAAFTPQARADARPDDPRLRLVSGGDAPPTASEVGRRRRWTEADDLSLKRFWSEGLTARAISERLQRSEASVATRASVLKLKRDADCPLIPSAREARNSGRTCATEQAAAAHCAKAPTTHVKEAATNGNGASGERASRNGHGFVAPTPALPEGPIDTVIRFLRSRDYSVVRIDEGRFRLDEREDLTPQELLSRANKVRAHLRQPPFPVMAS